MAVFPRRERVIGVRVTEEEHEAMNAFCVQSGLRSVADLARKAVLHYIAPIEKKSSLAGQESLNSAGRKRNQQVRRLEKQVEELRTEVAALKDAHKIVISEDSNASDKNG